MSTAQPIRSKHEVRELAAYYLKRGQIRNHILIVVGLYTALRISDLLRLKWEDVYDFSRGCVRATISIVERKTRKAKAIALNQAAVIMEIYNHTSDSVTKRYLGVTRDDTDAVYIGLDYLS